MRFRSFLLLVFWVGLLGYLGWGAFSAAASYFQVSELVDQAVSEVTRRPRAGGVEMAGPELASDARAAILLAARRNGVAMEPRNLVVAPAGGALHVSFKWSHPLITYGGESVISVPLSLDRYFDIRKPL